ncbi:MAG: DUF2085 domain-containing protein [Candidatus Aminicenantales bacterium]
MPRQDASDISLRRRPETPKTQKTILLTFVLTLIVFSIFSGGIILAPYLRSSSSAWASLVYDLYTPFCHQLPERSMTCFGQPLAVCSRCLGIYLGIFLGLILYPFIRGWQRASVPERKVFFLLSVPIALDTAANFSGLWQSHDAVRLLTGLLWGALLPFYFIAGVVDFLEQRQKRKRGRAQNNT